LQCASGRGSIFLLGGAPCLEALDQAAHVQERTPVRTRRLALVDDVPMSIGALVVGVIVAVLGVSLIADIPRRLFPDPASQQKLAEASLGGRIALGSRRVRVAYGTVCLALALLIIVVSS
jgi:hypothetical protein